MATSQNKNFALTEIARTYGTRFEQTDDEWHFSCPNRSANLPGGINALHAKASHVPSTSYVYRSLPYATRPRTVVYDPIIHPSGHNRADQYFEW